MMNDASSMLTPLPGRSKPFGCTKHPDGINFAIHSKLATSVTLCFFNEREQDPFYEFALDSEVNKTGDVWHVLFPGLPNNLCYAYRIEKNKGKVYNKYFQRGRYLLDPYSKCVVSTAKWESAEPYHPLGLMIHDDTFDWENDKPLNIPKEELIIYEMHVRGFTKDPSSRITHPGTFLGVIEKIPYLLDLGINAVELLPINEFNEKEYRNINPYNQKTLCNYWGYSPIQFFSPMNRYASGSEYAQSLREFKCMVKELHRNGIEVILDVVFNHTGEKDKEMIYSLLGIDPSTYYLFDSNHRMQNLTGCGNTTNLNHPVMKALVKDCLHYWVTDMHVDGFRFDLAGTMFRGRHGEALNDSPLLEELTEDSILANTKLIAEPWDASGLYKLGKFNSSDSKWSEWNDRYRDDVRQFIKGDRGRNRAFATRICGSDDIFGKHHSPTCSINYVTAHDGFSLRDLVTYNHKHNAANGENNRDGHSANYSWNCGLEGETDDQEILDLRIQQMKNFHLILMLSLGIPMITMGNEYGHSKKGNNNAWCQDNRLNWFQWDQLEKNQDFFRFYKACIRFRKNHTVFRRTTFYTEEDIDWHGLTPFHPKWERDTNFLAYTIKDHERKQNLYIACNAHHHDVHATLPEAPDDFVWRRIVDTSLNSPDDYVEEHQAPQITDSIYHLNNQSVIVLKCF
jgi:isoamylase